MTGSHKNRALLVLPIAAALLLAAFTVPSLGLVSIAQADDDDEDRERGDRNNDRERDDEERNNRNNDDDDREERDDNDDEDEREFSRLFGRGSDDDDRDEDRKPKVDPKGDSPFLDLDIRDYGFRGKDAYIQVYGTAGGTVGEHDAAIAYVLNIVTKSGEEQTWAVDSHEIQHGDTGTGEDWHAHRVHLTDNPATPEEDATCLNEVDEVTEASMKGKYAVFEGMKSKDIQAKRITSAATVKLQLQVDDPDNPPPGTECIAIVVEVYDTADLTKRERRD